MDWYRLSESEVLEKLETSAEQGLSDAEVIRRREKHGPNELIDRGMKSAWKILLEQLTGLMIIILFVSAVISLLLGETKDAIAILVIVALNAVLGFTQEYRAEKAMAALKKMSAPVVRVRRNGHIQEVQAFELVPGDVILLEAGNVVPADSMVLEAVNLRSQEAVLTGESEPVEKHPGRLVGENVALGDQRNLLFMGTVITYGRGSAVVVETGMSTQLGRIAEMLQTVAQEATPLQRRLDQLAKGLAVAALIIVAVVFGLGVLRGESFRLMFQTAISMAVAAVPEGLPAVVTIALALGAQRMLQRRALIRKLPAVETLGSITYICSDKTGTLTQNRMTVTILDVAENRFDILERVRDYSPRLNPAEKVMRPVLESPAAVMLLAGGALCNDAILEASSSGEGDFSAIGDPTEGALVVAAAQAGLWKAELDKSMPRIAEVPFTSERKRMTTVHKMEPQKLPQVLSAIWEKLPRGKNQEFLAITKGAVDSLVEVSRQVWVSGEIHPLDEHWRGRIQAANNKLAQNGMRVLGVGIRLVSQVEAEDPEGLEKELIFVGMFGMIDPARPEVRDAVATAKAAGIRPVMITGDHPLTAQYIARELGISTTGRVVTGQELSQISDKELAQRVEEIEVYARVSPEHKLKIVNALQSRGHIVAMTGDGVNDAPALKRADIGVAMGITGTDVSKEASDMVLLDDNFATIVAAIEEGRRIYDNIRKFIKYTMTSNAGEIWVMLLGPFLGMPLPLAPLQILWINLVTDGLPGLALSVEPAEPNTMKRPPHRPNENIFGRGLARDTLWVGLLLGLVSLGVGYLFWRVGDPYWQTIIFTTLTLAQMGNAFATRSDSTSLFKIGLMSNPRMLIAVVVTFLLQLAVVYLPFMQDIFNTKPMPLYDLALCVGIAVLVFLTIELGKWIIRRMSAR
ncbi:MAG: cation-translocating P-type ATPase [Anaerolineae bacterium]|nr:cation-translocating P-type ATPase [Anaerolineae bacterium]